MLLLGDRASKRTIYMERAAGELHTEFQWMDWEALLSGSSSFDISMLSRKVIKLDPLSYQTVSLEEMGRKLTDYLGGLKKLEDADAVFLNTPAAISVLLDKKRTKKSLEDGGVPITQIFDICPQKSSELFLWMEKERVASVFVKPRLFSGAAGVMALRRHPRTGKMNAYTSCHLKENALVNTKKLYVLQKEWEILPLLDRLLELGCVVERWHPKAQQEGRSFDLRVVWQFGHIAHIVVRCSHGPITNLHLNNQAMDFKALGMSESLYYELEQVCLAAMQQFPGLQMAGIDVLIEKGSLKPLIIEMNGQGDLIYQDIYGDNRIYREQAARMKQWEEQK